MASSPTIDQYQSPQCWECLRRKWLCDGTRPTCSRCLSAGLVCPGYGGERPLFWLPVGMVSRRSTRQPSGNRRRPSSDGHLSGAVAAANTGTASREATAGSGARPAPVAAQMPKKGNSATSANVPVRQASTTVPRTSSGPGSDLAMAGASLGCFAISDWEQNSRSRKFANDVSTNDGSVS